MSPSGDASKKTGMRNRTEHAPVLSLLGERLQQARRARGLTQRDLADALAISVAYLSLMERGGRNPPYSTVARLARELEVPVARLFPG